MCEHALYFTKKPIGYTEIGYMVRKYNQLSLEHCKVTRIKMMVLIPTNHQAKVSDVKSLDAKNRVDVMKDQSGNVKDYHWSIKPLVIWMILLGIFPPLQNSNKRSQFAELKRIFSLVFRISTWLATGTIQLYLVYVILFGNPNAFFVAAKFKSTAKWNNMFFYTSHMLHAIGIHSFLLISFNEQWTNFQASLESTETQQLKRHIPYANLRKWCLYGFIYIFITVSDLIEWVELY